MVDKYFSKEYERAKKAGAHKDYLEYIFALAQKQVILARQFVPIMVWLAIKAFLCWE
jgi:hypothetical protein